MNARFPKDRSVAAEAAAWIARLQREDRDADLEQRFRQWLRSDPAHAAAFEEATTLWHRLPGVGALFREQESRWQWRPVAMAATVLLVAGISCLAYFLRGDTYATAVGEQRLVKLDDGSWITLNTDTEIRARLDGSKRTVRLLRGEALFDVANDAGRPFIVTSGDETVEAVGTSFVVRSDGNVVSVALLEGKVLVDASSAAIAGIPAKPIEMTAGEYWRSQDRVPTRISPARMDELTAWRHGELVFNNVQLRDAVAEVNRYTDIPLVLRTPGAGDLPISGVFKIRDHTAFAQTAAALYGLKVEAEPGRLLISGHAASRP